MKIRFNSELDSLFDYLSQQGGKCYLVGGAVRDYCYFGSLNVLGDLDFEVHLLEFDFLCECISNFFEFDLQGSFGVIVLRGTNVQIAVPRKENAIGVGHRDFFVNLDPFMGCYEAGLRRDFTINALMLGLDDGEVVDNYNCLMDLKLGLLRHVSDKFSEDGLRVFRGIRFASRFDFDFDSSTWELFFTMRDCVLGLSGERVNQELRLLFKESYVVKKVSLLVELLDFYLSLDCVSDVKRFLSNFVSLDVDSFLVVYCYFVADFDVLCKFCGVSKRQRQLICRVCEYLKCGVSSYYELSSLSDELLDVCLKMFELLGFDFELVLRRVSLVRSLKLEYDGSYFVCQGFKGKQIAVMQREVIIGKVEECYE